MSDRNSKSLSRRHFLGLSVGAVVSAGIGCSSESSTSSGTGGQTGTGGSGTGGAGSGATGTGAAAGTGGAGVGVTGGAGGGLTGGAGGTSSGGAGGSSTTGGTAGGTTGGAGGNPAGGAGGTSTGGSTTGGAGGSTGGSTTGSAGDSATGGAGGTATGGVDGNTGGVVGTGGGGGTELGYVTLVRATDWKTAVKDACLARMPDLSGRKVIVRPNVIEAEADSTTSPEVIAGVVAAAKEKGASEILICEDAFRNEDCVASMQTLGIAEAVGSDAEPTNLIGTATTNVSLANASAWGSAGIDFYDLVADSSAYVVNVPKCKTHGIAGFSMALKAWLGSLKRPGDLHSGNVDHKCAEAHLVRQEDLVVLDATRCMVTAGPMVGGEMKDSALVVVTEDPIAADVTGVAILKANGVATRFITQSTSP